MPSRTTSLAELEAFLAAKSRALRFPAPIEALFDGQTRSYRARVMQSTVVPATVVYNLFLVADWLLVPDTFGLAALLHFCLVTPVIFLVGYGYDRIPRQGLRDVAAAAVPVLMVVQIMTIYALNATDLSHHYQYLAVNVVVYMNVNLRLGFRFAVATTATLVALYLAVLVISQAPLPTVLIGASMMINAGYLTLNANLRMERDVRHAFLRRLREQLLREDAQTAASRDALTGISNRRHLDAVAEELWKLPDDKVSPVAIVMIDIDRFKAYNDHLGHQAGDACLKSVAGAIASELRGDADLAVRYGGEEFLVLLPRTEFGDAARLAERIRRRIEGLRIPHASEGIGGIVTASFGVMAGPVSAHSISALISGADVALYAAKRSGRNQVWPPFPKVREDAVGHEPRQFRKRRG